MKNLIVLLLVFMSLPTFAQQAIYTDNDGDGIIEYTLYNKNGKVEETGFYVNGKMTGTWTSYYPNGKKKMVAKFRNGVKHGTWLVYDSKNRVVTEVVYNNNKKVSASQHNYASN